MGGTMRKCLYFFLGLMGMLSLAVLTGSHTGEEKAPEMEAVLDEEAARTEGMASKTPQKREAEFVPAKQAP